MKSFLLSVACALLSICASAQSVSLTVSGNDQLKAGQTCELKIALNNTEAVTATEINLILPEGITIAEKQPKTDIPTTGDLTAEQLCEWSGYKIACADRCSATHTSMHGKKSNGNFFISNFSLTNANYVGTEGDILSIMVNVAPEFTSGEMKLVNCFAAKSATEKVTIDDATVILSLASIDLKGDMNKNGMLDAGDLAMMLDCLVNEVENLDGDMNGNGQLDAGDMGMLVDELVNGGDNVREQVAAVRAQAAGENPFTMDVLDATVGSEENELVFNLTGATAYSTAIYNVTLPEGYTFYFDEDEDDYVITMNIAKPEFTTKLTNNTLRIVAKSGSSKLFKADEGFMKIQIVAAADAKPGFVTISKLQFGKPDGGLLELEDVTGMIRVNGEEPTGISAIAGIKTGGAIFDLSGRKVAKLQKGINIINGTKIVK